MISKNTEGTCESCLFLVLGIYYNLVVTRVSIQKIVERLPCKSLEHLIHEGKRVVIFFIILFKDIFDYFIIILPLLGFKRGYNVKDRSDLF